MNYTYRIINNINGYAEVLYSSDNLPNFLVGMDYSQTTLEQAIQNNAPLDRWLNDAYLLLPSEKSNYEICDTHLGKNYFFETKDDALNFQNNLIKSYIDKNLKIDGLPIEYLLIDDWYVAFSKYCEITNQIPKSKKEYMDEMVENGQPDFSYSHSVYNLTTKTKWSNTFRWNKQIDYLFLNKIKPDINNIKSPIPNETLYHFKVKEGKVTDIYTLFGEINKIPRFWVTYDLETGEPFEYYTFEGDMWETNSVMHKHLVSTDEIIATTHFISSFDDIPNEQKLQLNDFPYKEAKSLWSWAQKDYGFIIEYIKNVETELIDNDKLSKLNIEIKCKNEKKLMDDVKNIFPLNGIK